VRLRWLPAVVGALVVTLAACAPASNPFGRGPLAPEADEASLDAARQMDRIEQALAEGDYATAERELEAALAAGNQHPRLWMLQGRLYAGRGGEADLERAVEAYERALGESPRWLEVRIDLADVYLRLDRLASAESVYRDLDRIAPEHPVGPYGRGWVALLQGRDEVARAHLEEALRRDPEHAASLFARSRLASQDGELVLERSLLERFLVEEPKAAGGWRALGDVAEQQGLREDARRAFERAYALEPRVETARRLAELARIRGDRQAARVWAERAGAAE